MDQIKIGAFLRELRRERDLTQETLAERLGVSNRTVSRWETGSNMPDIGMLAEIAGFYGVSIPEIINGERKSEMNEETKETAEKMAEYGHAEVKRTKRRAAGLLLTGFGIFVIFSALMIFPSESSWGSIYALLGSGVLLVGIFLLVRTAAAKMKAAVLSVLLGAVLLFGFCSVFDYIAVVRGGQVPRFRYVTEYNSNRPDETVYRTLFFDAVLKDRGTANEHVEIMK